MGEDTGFPRELLEESLGHQIGTAVERAYRRTDSFDRRRAIMQAWADFCGGKPVGRRGVGAAKRGKRQLDGSINELFSACRRSADTGC